MGGNKERKKGKRKVDFEQKVQQRGWISSKGPKGEVG
jgi:hypothetical protein